jgi:hypothetical protein
MLAMMNYWRVTMNNSKLKTDKSTDLHDIAIKGQELYACGLNEHQQVDVWALDAYYH